MWFKESRRLTEMIRSEMEGFCSFEKGGVVDKAKHSRIGLARLICQLSGECQLLKSSSRSMCWWSMKIMRAHRHQRRGANGRQTARNAEGDCGEETLRDRLTVHDRIEFKSKLKDVKDYLQQYLMADLIAVDIQLTIKKFSHIMDQQSYPDITIAPYRVSTYLL